MEAYSPFPFYVVSLLTFFVDQLLEKFPLTLISVSCAVVNLTLIDLPGLTKVAVGMDSFLLGFFCTSLKIPYLTHK